MYILPATKFQILLVASLFICTSFIEALGIGIVGPFLSLANDFDSINETPILSGLSRFLGIERANYFVALLGLAAIILFLIKSFIAWSNQVFITRFSDRQQRLLIVKLAGAYLKAPYVYHLGRNSSAIVDRLIEIANAFSSSVFMPLLTTLANVFLFVALFILLCFTSFKIMLTLLIVLIPVIIFFNSFAPKIRNWGKEMRESKADIIKTVNHAFGSIKETKIIGCESFFEDEILKQARKLEVSHRTFISFRLLPRFVLESVIVSSVIAIVSASVFMNGEGIAKATSALGVFALASIRLLPAISNSINGVNQLRASSFTINQIYNELSELSELKDEVFTTLKEQDNTASISLRDTRVFKDEKENTSDTDWLYKESFEKEISLDNITYRYPESSRPALENISLTISKGESIAFIGKSGAGKTTLIDVILGLLCPQEGDLLVDGSSIYEHLDYWRKLVAYIPQSIFLIDDTIASNIAFGMPKHLIDKKSLEHAIQVAQLSEVIENLQNGVETQVGERGILLSGGQKQRVGIARAIYHGKQILVLDEATAALDSETEKLITDSIFSLSSNKDLTLITIAHRLTSLKYCDRVYTLSDGKIIDVGTYKQIVS